MAAIKYEEDVGGVAGQLVEEFSYLIVDDIKMLATGITAIDRHQGTVQVVSFVAILIRDAGAVAAILKDCQ